MSEKLIERLGHLNFPSEAIERVRQVLVFYEGTCAEEILDVVVSEDLKENGVREVENLWFASESYLMEAKAFAHEDNFDMAYMLNSVKGWEVQKENYDFENANELSRFYLIIFMEGDTTAEIKSSGLNCDHLRDFFFKHVVRNMRK